MELGSGGNVSTDELNIKELITDIWISKFFILSLSILAGIFSLMIAFSMPQKYLSESILFPETDSSESLPSSLSFVETFTGQLSDEISNKALTELNKVYLKWIDGVQLLKQFFRPLQVLVLFELMPLLHYLRHL